MVSPITVDKAVRFNKLYFESIENDALTFESLTFES